MHRLDDSGYYDGSRVFSFLVEPLGLSVDQVINTIIIVYNNYQFMNFSLLSTRSISF